MTQPLTLTEQTKELWDIVQDGVNRRSIRIDFIKLPDTPTDYDGYGGYGVRVNTDESGLEYYAIPGGGTDEKVGIDSLATAGYIGSASSDGVLRTSAPLTYTDGGDYITLGIDETAIDHDNLLNFASNEHFTEASIDHGSITGLGDDDHSIYILADGTRAFSGNQSFGDNNITNVGDIALDSLTADGTEIDVNSAMDMNNNGLYCQKTDASNYAVIYGNSASGFSLIHNNAGDTAILQVSDGVGMIYTGTTIKAFLPGEDNTHDLGSVGAIDYRWKDLKLAGNLDDETNQVSVAQCKTAYDHSQIAGGNSVHVSTTENTNWDAAYSHIHNLTTDIDHDALTNFVANEHIDWTGASAGTIDATNIEDKFLRNDGDDETTGTLTINNNAPLIIGTGASADITQVWHSSEATDMVTKWDDTNSRFDVNKPIAAGGADRSIFQRGAVINEGSYDSDTRIEGATDIDLVFVDAGNDKVGIGTSTPAEKLDVDGNVKADAYVNQEYMVPIWAEENSTLAAGAYEWAFGNGANSALDDGVTIYVPSGWTCAVVAMSLKLGATPTAITVELGLSGVLQGANCDVTATGVRAATNDSFTPVAVVDGDYITFRTTSVSGSTLAPNVVTAWLKYTKT